MTAGAWAVAAAWVALLLAVSGAAAALLGWRWALRASMASRVAVADANRAAAQFQCAKWWYDVSTDRGSPPPADRAQNLTRTIRIMAGKASSADSDPEMQP